MGKKRKFQQAISRGRAELAEARAVPQPGPGAVNAYVCMTCQKPTVTVHKDRGTTPMLIRCQAGDDCEGMAKSTLYHPIPEAYKPTIEWYAPDRKETAGLSYATRMHVDKGGLLARPIIEEPSNAS